MLKNVLEQDVTQRIQPHYSASATQVMIAGDDIERVKNIQTALAQRGYLVTAEKAQPRLLATLETLAKNLSNRSAAELLIVECSNQPWIILSLVEKVRKVYPALPIILITQLDPEIRAEARRLAVDIMMTFPADTTYICQAATKLAPLIPEVEEQQRKA